MSDIKILDSFEYSMKGDKPGVVYIIHEYKYGYDFKVIKQGEKWFEFPGGHSLGAILTEDLDLELRQQKFKEFEKHIDDRKKREPL